MHAQIIKDNVCTKVIVIPNDAILSADGLEATWPNGYYRVEPDEKILTQKRAGLGWILSNGVLEAPPPPPLPPPSIEDLKNYVTKNRLYVALNTPRTYAISDKVSLKADASSATLSDLRGLHLWGTTNPTSTTQWVDNTNVVTTITGAQCVEFALTVHTYVQSVYAVLAKALTQISDKTITTIEETDALAWQ